MKDLFGNEKILALSWKQPFAELMLHGKIETRTWNTNYRGLVLICASKQGYSNQQIKNIAGESQYQRILSLLGLYPTQNVGCAIAIGKLIDCRPMQLKDEDRCFVQYRPDLFCHVYEDVRVIEPFKWKGTQGWKTVTPDVIDRIKFI